MARLHGTYQLPDGTAPVDGRVLIRVPKDRNASGKTVTAKAVEVAIDPGTGAYDSGTIPDGPYEVRRDVRGAKDHDRWYDVILSGDTDLQTAIDTYDPTAYTPPVVQAAQAAANAAAQSAAAAANAAAGFYDGGIDE